MQINDTLSWRREGSWQSWNIRNEKKQSGGEIEGAKTKAGSFHLSVCVSSDFFSISPFRAFLYNKHFHLRLYSHYATSNHLQHFLPSSSWFPLFSPAKFQNSSISTIPSNFHRLFAGEVSNDNLTLRAARKCEEKSTEIEPEFGIKTGHKSVQKRTKLSYEITKITWIWWRRIREMWG